MTGKKRTPLGPLDPEDDAPELTDEQLARAEFSIGGRVIRPATGTLTKAFEEREKKGGAPKK